MPTMSALLSHTLVVPPLATIVLFALTTVLVVGLLAIRLGRLENALLLPDTAVPTLARVGRLEAEPGRTGLAANQVSLWRVAALADLTPEPPGLGRLFRTAAPVSA